MAYNIAVLTPIEHAEGVAAALRGVGRVICELNNPDYQQAIYYSQEAHILFVNPNKMLFKIDANFMDSCPRVKFIATASTGTNHIDLKAASARGIEVIALTKELDVIEQISSTAELAFALTLALVRRIPQAHNSVKHGLWDWTPFIGRQMNQLTAGVIGYGRLGRMYAEFARAFCKEVIWYDPYYVGGVELDELLERSDIISLHVHLNDGTRHMVNKEFLQKTKRKPYLVNTSRGDVVDEKEVLWALIDKTISGYGADVLSDELSTKIQDNPLVQAAMHDGSRNLILTPHVGGSTYDAMKIAYNATVRLLKAKVPMITEVIAEIGWNHMGSLELARKMIEEAARAGAAYAKFQSWSEKKLKPGPWDQDGRREIYKQAELSVEMHKDLMRYCNQYKIKFLSSAFSLDGAKLLLDLGCKEVKIPSTETSINYPLLKFVGENFDRIFMSTGACTMPEVQEAVSYMKDKEVVLFHCVSTYPCPPSRVNLPRINKLKELPTVMERPLQFGYSGHGEGIWDAVAALEYDIDFIEKHFTVDKNLPGRDNKFALLPEEMSQLCGYILDRAAMRIPDLNDYQQSEEEARNVYRGRWES